MRIVLMAMPDVVPTVIHESAVHMPNLGIASVGANVDPPHEVLLMDLVRRRGRLRRYLSATLPQLRPSLVGISAMAWQYPTALRVMRLVRKLVPQARIAIGGYHATLMHAEIAATPEAELIDFMVRGEGEETFRRLVNALAGADELSAIGSLSWRQARRFVHNPPAPLLDLSRLKLPIRDRRRLTGGYHFMHQHIEVLETSRGCTRDCTFCSMRHMYGRTFRPFPIERVLADLDQIVRVHRVRLAFVADDNMVLDPRRVIALCTAIRARRYRGLKLVVQADCQTMAQQPDMVAHMGAAGVSSVFLGIESASRRNLALVNKERALDHARQAVANCHRSGIMVIGGMIFGLPEDDEASIVANYRFLKELQADAAYCQLLTPYPKTRLREQLLAEGLVTNACDYGRYTGLWANVRTRHLDAQRLQYLFWLHRQRVLGFWEPSPFARAQGPLWTGIWIWLVRPLLRRYLESVTRRHGWRWRYQREMARLEAMNRFPDLEP
jgi:radical SAM superfamily enzyme YgiQ (UPF0313 family)